MARGVRWGGVGLALFLGLSTGPAPVIAATALDELEALFPDLNPPPPASPLPKKKKPVDAKTSSRQENKSLQLSGSFREEAAFRISDPQQLTKLRSVAYAAGTGNWSDNISYKASGWVWYDAVYSLTNHYPQDVKDDQKVDSQIRDTYVDISQENFDFRVGKQQIVWGEAIGTFYADVVNAKDFREFILQDFDLIRIPEWGIDTEYTHEAFHAEALWLPWPEMDRVGRPGSEYYFTAALPPGVPITYGPEDKPTDSLANGEVGGRLSYRLEGWDASLFHLRTWDKTPVYTAAFSPSGLTLTATHPRLTIDGLTLAKDLGGTVYKGEAVYYTHKYFESNDLTVAPAGIVPKDFVNYFIGADHTFDPKLATSVQLGQQIIRHYETSLLGEKALKTNLSISVRHPMLDNHLEPSILVVRDLGSTDMMFTPQVSYKFAGRWRLSGGFDILDGPADGLFGEFSQHNRVWSEVRVDF